MSPRGFKDEDTSPPETDHDDWSLDKYCTAESGKVHTKQLTAGMDRSPWIHLMCARQSGKSRIDLGILFDNAVNNPNTTGIFLGLIGTAVKFSMWVPIWLPLCERFGYADSKLHNNTNMVTTFPNGSRVAFAGTDDLTNVRKYLGNSFPGGVFIVDECQDQKPRMLEYIVEKLLPPTLTNTSRVILSGVLPDVPAGYFYDRSTGMAKARGWSNHEWARRDNVFQPDAMAWLTNHMREFNIPEDDPQIRRDWYMERAWDPNATVFRYDRARNAYSPPWPPALECFALGIDPGTRDRTAIEVIGWSAYSRDIWHLHEWCTDANSGTKWSEIIAEVRRINQRWPIQFAFYDAGGSQMTLDLFTRDSGIPVLKAANKNDMPGQVSRLSDLLATGRFHCLEGSALEKDFQLSRWDKEARIDGRYEWSSDNHPDAADACRYALGGYWDSYTEPDPVPLAEKMLREYMTFDRHRWEPGKIESAADPIAEMLGIERDW